MQPRDDPGLDLNLDTLGKTELIAGDERGLTIFEVEHRGTHLLVTSWSRRLRS